MPKLTEMLYTSAMILASEYFAKFIHFSFGVLTIIAIYKLSRKYFSKNSALLSAIVFYSCLVVGWESITAYVDLTRTFFEIMTFWGFVNWVEKNEKKWLVISGAILGLAVTTKLVSFSTILIFIPLFIYNSYLKKEKFWVLFKNLALFCFISILVPIPWFVFSFINTGNPYYPYFTNNVVDSGSIFALPNASLVFKDLYTFFLNLNDPISPIYLIVLPLIVINFKNFSTRAKELLVYTLMAIVIWYLSLENRGGRFIMPYLPVFSILTVYSIKQFTNKFLNNFLIIVIILFSIISIGYRGIANAKFIPFIIGKETKSDFLNRHLNFSFGDFYDTDGYFKSHIKNSDTVLLYGFHNLYYANFNFIDSSWVKKGYVFNYIAVQNVSLPDRFNSWQLVYYNQTTMVKLYSLEGKQWVY
jgi:4-amino-4-deoxy-L-arabinose transferase-like glycosyltransferase